MVFNIANYCESNFQGQRKSEKKTTVKGQKNEIAKSNDARHSSHLILICEFYSLMFWNKRIKFFEHKAVDEGKALLESGIL